jgi:ketosteroid isomerase-like protein
MARLRAIDEADIRQRIDKWAEAIRAMDLEGVMSIYAPEIVAFDLDSPLQYVGAEAKRERWLNVFATYQRPLSYEFATSRSPWAMTWPSGTASIGSAAY